MSLMNLRGNVLIATLLVLSISCGVTNPQPAPGTILGSGNVTVPNHGTEDYFFEEGGESYGYVTFSYDKYPSWFDIEISAPFGIQEGSGDMAPATGYTTDFINVVLSQSYFFRPDSLHYGYLEIILLNNKSLDSAFVAFDWIIQTEPNNREFY